VSPAANLLDGLLHGELAPALDVVEDIEFGKMSGWWSTFAGDRVAAGNVIHIVQAHCFLHWQVQVGYMFGPRHVCVSPCQQVHVGCYIILGSGERTVCVDPLVLVGVGDSWGDVFIVGCSHMIFLAMPRLLEIVCQWW
jgi:hypothetical protein